MLFERLSAAKSPIARYAVVHHVFSCGSGGLVVADEHITRGVIALSAGLLNIIPA